MRSDKCKKVGFDSFFGHILLLMQACSSGWSNWCTFVPVFGDLGAFLGHILFHIGAFHPMLGLS